MRPFLEHGRLNRPVRSLVSTVACDFVCVCVFAREPLSPLPQIPAFFVCVCGVYHKLDGNIFMCVLHRERAHLHTNTST